MSEEDRTKYWENLIADELVGRKIVSVRYWTQAEADFEDWYQRPVQIELDNGYVLIPMRDDEGNDGGSIATNIEALPTIPVL
jgi:hypothetical protein